MADDDLVNVGNQFKGLPIDHLVGAPLKAACDAQMMLAHSVADFIDKVGFQPAPKGGANASGPRVAKQVEFSMSRPHKLADGSIGQEKVDLAVPVLAIVPIPSLLVDNVSVDFEMSVHSQFSYKDADQEKLDIDTAASVNFGVAQFSVKIHGEVAHQHEQTRSGDNTAKYRFHVEAKQQTHLEGLNKVLDILNTACAPIAVTPLQTPKGGIAPPALASGGSSAPASTSPPPAPPAAASASPSAPASTSPPPAAAAQTSK